MAISETEESIQIISFNIGPKRFGVDLLSIREILRDPDIEVLDKVPGFVEGIVRLRGEVIPVIDLDRRIGNPEEATQRAHKWIMIANTEGYNAGFIVDGVTRILKISSDQIIPAPDLVHEEGQRPYVRGVCDSEIGMLVVLDLGRMLSTTEISELKKN